MRAKQKKRRQKNYNTPATHTHGKWNTMFTRLLAEPKHQKQLYKYIKIESRVSDREREAKNEVLHQSIFLCPLEIL